MLYSFPTRYRNFIWFLIFTFMLYSMPHLEALFPFKIYLFIPEAGAAETQEETHKEAPDKQDPPEEISNKKQPAVPTASVTSTSTDPIDQLNSGISFKVDDFTGAAHLSYPIIVPPGRGGLSPQLSLNYSSSVGNGWLGVGWDLSLGFIQRKGPRKGVPKYNDTLDVFELQVGGGPQELVCIANCPPGVGNLREYRLKIEGAYLKITYDVSGNKWEVRDKSGIKMWFGTSSSSRIGKVRDPGDGTDTYRWHLDRVEDPKTNYMEITYFRDQYTNNTYPMDFAIKTERFLILWKKNWFIKLSSIMFLEKLMKLCEKRTTWLLYQILNL